MVRFITTAISLAAILASAPVCVAFTSPVPTTAFSSGSIKVSNNIRMPESIALQASETFEDGDPAIVQTLTDVLVLGLRIGTCSLMIHHGFDKVINVDGFSANVVAKFFGFLPGPPAFWTLSAAATQIGGAGLLSLGIFARPVALSMSATMLAAVTFHLLNTGAEGFPLAVVSQHSYNFELAAMYVLVLAYFGVAGAGNISVDEQVLGGELNFYGGIINGVLGKNNEEE